MKSIRRMPISKRIGRKRTKNLSQQTSEIFYLNPNLKISFLADISNRDTFISLSAEQTLDKLGDCLRNFQKQQNYSSTAHARSNFYIFSNSNYDFRLLHNQLASLGRFAEICRNLPQFKQPIHFHCSRLDRISLFT